MKSKHLVPFLFLTPLLAGCLQGESNGFDAQCIAGTCLADPNSHDAQYMLNTYGLRQINNDESKEARVQADGDLVIWQTLDDNIDGNPASDLFAYRFSTESLLPIAISEYHLFKFARLSGEKVVYTVEPQPGAEDFGTQGAWLMLWNATTGESRRLDPGLDGSQESFAFDGTWVTFWNRGSQNETENAFWALNTDDGRLRHVYTMVPREHQPDDALEALVGFHATNGSLYYLTRHTDKNNTFFKEEWHHIDLEIGESRLYHETYDEDESNVGQIMGTDTYILGDGPSFYLYELENALLLKEYKTEPKSTAFDLNDEIILYRAAYHIGYDFHKNISVLHMETGEKTEVIPVGSDGDELSSDDGGLTGGVIVLAINRIIGNNFNEGLGSDLYWLPIDELDALPWKSGRTGTP